MRGRYLRAVTKCGLLGLARLMRPTRSPAQSWRCEMKIVVIGGSGLIGTKVVRKLTEQGHEALAASPKTGVDATTGRGLAEALSRADVVVDVSNSPSFEDAPVLAFFENSGRNLERAEKEAGVRHHVALSVVGTDRLP